MFSLQRWISKGNRFFELLEAGADEALQSVHALAELVAAPQHPQGLEKLIASRRQEKQIHLQLTTLVCSTFITPLEREDIEALSNALSRITKVAKKAAQRFVASQAVVRQGFHSKQLTLIEQGTGTLCQMVRELRHGPRLEKTEALNRTLHCCEGEADKLMQELLNDIYCGTYEPREMLVTRDLIEMLEKIIDRCRDAGNIVFQIALKNSGERTPEAAMTLIFCIIVCGLAFEYINGFHDTANAIATVVSTRVLGPRQAIMMAAVCNLLGALIGTAVAKTIGKGLIDTDIVRPPVVLSALLAAVAWNLFTLVAGPASSSSHALIGGLCGATLAAAAGKWSVIHWLEKTPTGWEGLLPKVIVPMVVSPLLGLVLGFALMGGLMLLLQHSRPYRVNLIFGRLQLVSASLMALSHGTNDAQKTMGIITLTLWTATQQGDFASLPSWLHFLRTPEFSVAFWVKILCSLTMAMGTAAGGWRIIRTLGHRMVRLQPIHGFAAETAAAGVIQVASALGVPLSTTHVISASIMGVGAARRFNAVKWSVVGRMVWAWVLTLPATALLGYVLYHLFRHG